MAIQAQTDKHKEIKQKQGLRETLRPSLPYNYSAEIHIGLSPQRTVPHLECHGPLPGEKRRNKRKLTLRPVHHTDTVWLEDLRRLAYQELFTATWGGWDEARHKRHFAACLQRGNLSIITANGEAVGMIQMFEDDHDLEIGEIQLLPAFQNCGIGRQVLRNIISTAHEQGKNVVLSLGLKNEGAYRLYISLGFQEIRRSETHIHMSIFPSKHAYL